MSPRVSIYKWHRVAAVMLLSILASCQAQDAYEARLDKCLENVEIIEFSVEGSTAKGLSYYGFDAQCLVGAPLPVFRATTTAGDEVSTSALKGKVVVINFWFIKCAPCIAEIPLLNSIVDKYGTEEVYYLSLCRGTGYDIEQFLKKTPFHFAHIPEADFIIDERFQMIMGYPSTIVANQEGEIVGIFQGAKSESDPSVDVATAVGSMLHELLRR